MNFWFIFWMVFSVLSLMGCIVGIIYLPILMRKDNEKIMKGRFNRDVEYIEKLISEKDYAALFFVGQLCERYSLALPDNRLYPFVLPMKEKYKELLEKAVEVINPSNT